MEQKGEGDECQRQAHEKEEIQKNRKSGTATGTTCVVLEVIVVVIQDADQLIGLNYIQLTLTRS